MRMPGYPAFLMSTRAQKREACVRFGFVVLFSLLPLILIGFLDGMAAAPADFFGSVGRYTEAGQIYFYIGAIIGSAFLLVRDNFREDRRPITGKPSGGDEIMRTERTWFTLYMVCVAVASAVILSVYHLKADKNPSLIYWSSAIIYGISLYVWFVDILYSQINPANASLEPDDDDDGLPDVEDKIDDALNVMNTGATHD